LAGEWDPGSWGCGELKKKVRGFSEKSYPPRGGKKTSRRKSKKKEKKEGTTWGCRKIARLRMNTRMRGASGKRVRGKRL